MRFQKVFFPAPGPGGGWGALSQSDTVVYASFDGTDGDTSYSLEVPAATAGSFGGGARLEDTQAKFGATSCYLGALTQADINFGDISAADLQGDFTLVIHYYRDGTSGSTREALVGKVGESALGNNWSWFLTINDATEDIRFKVYTTGATTPSLTASINVTDNAHNDAGWHVIYIERSGNDLAVYLDQNLVHSETGTWNANPFLGTGVLFVGANNISGWQFNGYVDELIIFDSALGLGDVEQTTALSA